MGTYVIAGKGDVSQEVLTAGLNDLPGISMFYVPWIGSQNTRPSEGLRKVYDYLVDGELNFILLAKDKASVHPTIAEAADEVEESGSSSPELPPNSAVLHKSYFPWSTVQLKFEIIILNFEVMCLLKEVL